MGDVNGDGTISVSDVSRLYKQLKNKVDLADCYVHAGDVNNDSSISVSDISKIYRFLKGKISHL